MSFHKFCRKSCSNLSYFWGYVEFLFLQMFEALPRSKVGDMYLNFLIQNTKPCKEVNLECRKVHL